MKDYPESSLVTLYLGNLVYTKGEGDIKKLLSKYGKVLKVSLVSDSKTGRKLGIAFAQMTNLAAAEEAIKYLNGKDLDGRVLKISIAEERIPKPLSIAKVNKGSRVKKEKDELPDKKQKKKRKPKGLKVLMNFLDQK